MKNKLIFRILGALASALIIVSVFVPFVNVTGYSPNLWETYETTNSLYLPIMIIVFGAIGVIFFALNIKTELAYMSSGAITFFGVMQTIDILDQGVFNTLSIGYYFLVVGGVLTGIMAFLANLKSKQKEIKIEEVKKEETSMLDQIDRLYNEQSFSQGEMTPIQPVNNMVNPLSIQQINNIPEPASIQPMPEIVQQQPIVEQQPVVNPENVSIPLNNISGSVNPVVQEFNTPVVEVQSMVEQQPVVNPENMSVPLTNISGPVNPVVQEFNIPVVEVQPMVEQQPVVNPENVSSPLNNTNPVVQQFNNGSSTVNSQQNSSGVDIFGQPINK